MEETNKVYRIRTKVGDDAPNVIHVPLNQTYDMFEILSLKINQKNFYKTYNSDYGIIVGRVIANGGVGVPNAKVSVFMEVSSDDTLEQRWLYNFTSTTDIDNDGVRYNLLPDEVDDFCHQDVGTFPNKRLVLDNQDIIETFDKYWKYTTTTNNSGDYMIFGVPTGSQTLHCDIDLSDCGILSQRPRDMIPKGYNADMFESPNKFRSSKNINSLVQIVTQDKGVYVYPYWGDISNGDDNFAITRCDINIEYKFEPTAVFIGCIVTDKGSNALGRNCTANERSGKMSDLIAGEGTIEMIRKTIDNKVEEFPINGNRLIDGNGVWCYQIPMNLDIVKTDEFGNLVPTDDPNKGIATRARVRFRITLDENPSDAAGRKRARYLVPNNPRMGEGDFDDELEADYEFGSSTREESYCDLFWNKVYTVKNYIPKLQKNHKDTNRKHTGIKLINHHEDNNPMPYNALTIKLTFTYRIICTLTKIVINLIEFVNQIISLLGAVLCLLIKIIEAPGNILATLIPNIWPFKSLRRSIKNGWKRLMSPITNRIYEIMPSCIGLSSEFCDDGINQVTYYPGCGKFFFNFFEYSSIGLDCVWGGDGKERGVTQSRHEREEEKYCNEKQLSPEECALTLTEPSNETAMLYNCIENQLAQQNDATSFNFYNDWINGMLYAPLWYRKLRPKRSYLFGLIRKKAKDEWCTANKTYPNLRILHQCAVSRDGVTPMKNFDNNDIEMRYVENYRCDSKCHTKYDEKTGLKGLILPKETMLKQTVYYYKAVDHDSSLPKNPLVNSSKNGDIKLLFATDIVLLGSLNECDIHGVPQFFKALESSTYNMPSDILFTDYDFIMTVNKDGTTGRLEYDVDYEGVVKTSEMAGCDWGNTNEFGKHDGGLFYSIACTSGSTELDTKSCINLARICEFGVSLDMTKEIPDLAQINNDKGIIEDDTQIDNDDKYYQNLITDGFISWDELYNLDERSMFATMNGNRLQTKLNENNGLLEYDFRYLYPENFDGSLRNVMEDRTRRYSSDINYKNNWRLEKGSKDYYLFRMGNKPYYYDMDDLKEAYSFPRYENSFYFYFGLKAGKTAIEKFNSQYFAECNNTDMLSEQIGIKYQANSWCIMNGNDGYVAFDFSNIPTPYSLLINGVSNTAFSYTINEITEEKIILINDVEKRPEKLKDYVQLRGIEINDSYEYKEDGVVIQMIDNGSYSGIITDANGNSTEFTFKITGKYLTYNIKVQPFEEPNNTLIEIFNGNYNNISTDNEGLDTTDLNNITRKIGGVVTISNIFLNAEPIDYYKIEITSLLSSVEYNSLIKYSNGTITKEGIYPIYNDNNHHYAFGFPMGCVDYKVTITQLCIDENQNEFDSQNSVSTTVTVACPTPYKMYINDIDYDVIKNFDNNTGWFLEGNLDNPNARIVGNVDEIVVGDNPWFKVDNIFNNRFETTVPDTENPGSEIVIDYTESIIEFVIKYPDQRTYYNINNPDDIISEENYWDDNFWQGHTENRLNYVETFSTYAVIDNGNEYEINIDKLKEEFSNVSNDDDSDDISTDVPYIWVDDYIVDIERCNDASDFIQEVNKVLNNRKELRNKMKETFFMSCLNASKSFMITGQTNKLPCTQTICYHPEKAVENEDYNILKGDTLHTENVSTINDIKIPTITYKGSVYFGDGSDDDTPCLVETAEGKKKPYSAGIMNYSGISIPKNSNNKPFENEGDPKYIKWNTTKLADLFNFPLIDKILVADYIVWSSFVNIPKYGYDVNHQPYNKAVTMNGLLSGFIYNGNVVNDKFNQQTLNDIDLILSRDLCDKSMTYIEKRIINGFNYDSFANTLLETIKNNIKLSVTRDVVIMINNIFNYEIINPDNISDATINSFKQIISSLVYQNNKISYYYEGNELFGININELLQYVLAFTNYRVVNETIFDSPMQYAFILPISTMFILQDRTGCGINDMIQGDFAVTLSNESVNDCHGGEKIIKFETDGNDVYYSIFKAKDTNDNIVYPLNLAEQNAIQLWQIRNRIDNVYSQSQPQNIFSYQMKTEYLRGKDNLIDTNFKSKKLISLEDEDEEYEDTDGYGTTGEFIPRSNFNYPIFAVAEDENHVRAISPVYDYSNVTGKIKFGAYRRNGSQSNEYRLAIAVGNSHFYLDNYSYKLSGECKVDSATIIEFTQQTLSLPNQFIFANIDLATYNLIKEKLSSFIGMLFSDLSDNTTITAVDYTGLKHICSVDNRSFTETVWYNFTWDGRLPLSEGERPGVDTCGIRIGNGNYTDIIEYAQEEGDTVSKIVIPEAYVSDNIIATFLGWSEDQVGGTIVIDSNNTWIQQPSPVNSCKTYYANWDTTLPTYTVTFMNNDGTSSTLPKQHGEYVEKPEGHGSYYLYGDGTKTDVTFPYRVLSDVTFVEHTLFDVEWTEEILE